MARAAITLDIQETGNTAGLLGKLELELRGKALIKATRESLKPTLARAKATAPRGEPHTGKKAGKPHLPETLVLVTRDYGETKVGMVGPTYPEGAVGHLGEFGTKERVTKKGKRAGRMPALGWLRRAAHSTESQQKSAFEASLGKTISEASK